MVLHCVSTYVWYLYFLLNSIAKLYLAILLCWYCSRPIRSLYATDGIIDGRSETAQHGKEPPSELHKIPLQQGHPKARL